MLNSLKKRWSERRFNKIIKDIKDIRIQGATNVAKAGLEAYLLKPSKATINKIISLRPTEPFLFNILNKTRIISKKELLQYVHDSQDKINNFTFKIIKNNSVIFTHCHSSTVINALIYAKKNGKNFQVFSTETRPLLQGRKTARELAKAGIKVTVVIDSVADSAINKSDIVLFGADAILNDYVINKVGSGMFAEISSLKKVPLYILSISWKYYPKSIRIEQRDFREIWHRKLRNLHFENPAFSKINKKYVNSIISELGNLSYSQFLKKVKKR